MVRTSSVMQEEVSQLAKELIAKGEKPTIGRVRELLGNRGSPNTISRFLKSWREAEIGHIRQESDVVADFDAPKPAVKLSMPVEKAPIVAPAAVSSEMPKVMEPKAVVPPPVPPAMGNAPATVSTPPAAASVSEPPRHAHNPSPGQQQHHQPRRDKPFRDHKHPGQGGQPYAQGQGGNGFSGKHPHHKPGHHPHHAGQSPHKLNGGRPPFQDGRDRPFDQRQERHDRAPVSRPALSFEDTVPNVYVSENLDTLTTTQLITKVRRLESILNKEVSRRERADSMARDAKDYAEAVKAQIGARIDDIRESMELVIDSLQSQLKVMRENAEKDLHFYRDALQKAHDRLAQQRRANSY